MVSVGETEEDFKFECSGRVVTANCGIIGIGPMGSVYDGYDGGMGDSDAFTTPERVELADYMIERWTRYKVDATLKSREQ